MAEIIQLREANEPALKDIIHLLSQLRSDSRERTGTMDELRGIVGDPNTVVIVAKDVDRVVGLATLYIIRKVGRIEGHIDEVVVDEEYRGQGLGTKLMQELIAKAHAARVAELSLTSRPARAAANALYQKLGFVQRETNVYLLKL